MGNILSDIISSAVGPDRPGPDGPLHNEYWKQRMRGGEWILRNALLDGDMDKVFELLQVQNPDTPENPGALPPPNAFGDVNTLSSSASSCLVYLAKVSKGLWAAASDCTSCCIDVCCFYALIAICCCTDTSGLKWLLGHSGVERHPADQAEGGVRTRSTSPSGATTNTRPNDDDIALKKLPADFSLAKQYTDDGGFTALHYLCLGRTGVAGGYTAVLPRVPLDFGRGTEEVGGGGGGGGGGGRGPSGLKGRLRIIEVLSMEPRFRGQLVLALRVITKDGASPMHCAAAASEGNQAFAKILCSLASDVNLKSPKGVGPGLGVSVELGHGPGVPNQRVEGAQGGEGAEPAGVMLHEGTLSDVGVKEVVENMGRWEAKVSGVVDAAFPVRAISDGKGMTPVDLALSVGHVEAAREFGFDFLSSLETARGRVEACIAIDFLREAPAVGAEPFSSGAGATEMERVVVVHSDDGARLQTLARLRAEVQEQAGVDEEEAATLLRRNGYDVGKAVLACTAERDGVVDAEGGEEEGGGNIVGAGAEHGSAEQESVACPICFDEPEAGLDASVASLMLSCGHRCCDECLVAHACSRVIGEGDLSLLVCPGIGCRVPITEAAVRRLGGLPGGAGLVQRWEMLSASQFVNNCDAARWCPAPGCGRSVELPLAAGARAASVTCACGECFCFSCSSSPPHEPATCCQWKDFKKVHNEEAGWLQRHTTPCTGCRAPIERRDGCNHMRCTVCNHEFCFACGSRWTNVHYGCRRPEEGIAAPQPGSEANEEQRLRRLEMKYDEFLKLAHEVKGEEWGALCSRSGLEDAGSSLLDAQHAVVSAAHVVALSYVAEWALPSGFLSGSGYLKAKKTLRELRGRLEQAMSPLASLLASPARTDEGDARERVGIACVLEEGEEGAARRLMLKGLVEVLERERCVMVRAGRVGALSAKMEPKETIQYVIREGWNAVKDQTSLAIGATQHYGKMLLDKALGMYWGGAAKVEESTTVKAEVEQIQDQVDVEGGEGQGEPGGDPVVSSPPSGVGTGGDVDGFKVEVENAGDGQGDVRGTTEVEDVEIDVDRVDEETHHACDPEDTGVI